MRPRAEVERGGATLPVVLLQRLARHEGVAKLLGAAGALQERRALVFRRFRIVSRRGAMRNDRSLRPKRARWIKTRRAGRKSSLEAGNLRKAKPEHQPILLRKEYPKGKDIHQASRGLRQPIIQNTIRLLGRRQAADARKSPHPPVPLHGSRADERHRPAARRLDIEPARLGRAHRSPPQLKALAVADQRATFQLVPCLIPVPRRTAQDAFYPAVGAAPFMY